MPIEWRLGPIRRAFVLAAVLAVAVGLLLDRPSADSDGRVISTESHDASGPDTDSGAARSSPAQAVDMPRGNGGVYAGPIGGSDIDTRSHSEVKVAGHAESTRRYSVSADSAGGGVVVTNSGSAVAHSGGNTEVSGGDGEVAGVESGDVHAEGNRSTTQVGP